MFICLTSEVTLIINFKVNSFFCIYLLYCLLIFYSCWSFYLLNWTILCISSYCWVLYQYLKHLIILSLQFFITESDNEKKTGFLTDDCVSHVFKASKSLKSEKCCKSLVNINSYNFDKKWNLRQIENVTELKNHSEEHKQMYNQIDVEFVMQNVILTTHLTLQNAQEMFAKLVVKLQIN